MGSAQQLADSWARVDRGPPKWADVDVGVAAGIYTCMYKSNLHVLDAADNSIKCRYFNFCLDVVTRM